ncbi:MAG: CPBP family intramembrane glutamic endopeptidase [Eubacterium sp.]|nr:CPBP family intramembrane glutamic endopeptidase [Eubacterium sp.]
MLVLLFVLDPLYLTLFGEIGGTITSQLTMLAASILFVILMRADPREVFPFRKPKIGGIFGVLVVMCGAYLADIIISSLILFIEPEQTQAVNDSMESLFSGPSIILNLLLIALLPAICEEALHRGVILAGLRNSFSNKILVIGISGFLFGIFHIIPIRWWAPMLIGFVMAYFVCRTENMFYSCLLHFANNALIYLISAAAQGAVQASGIDSYIEAAAASVSVLQLGVTIAFYGVPIPILIYTGCWLVRRACSPRRVRFAEPGRERFTLWTLLGTTLAIGLTGIIIFCIGLL